MTDPSKCRDRGRDATAVGMLLAGAMALPLHAAAEPLMPAAAVDATASQIVIKDSATGALRAATPTEANALMQAKGRVVELRRGSPASPMTKSHWSGARGARLTDQFATYAVLVRQPDGSLVSACFESREQADEAMKAGLPVTPIDSAPTE